MNSVYRKLDKACGITECKEFRPYVIGASEIKYDTKIEFRISVWSKKNECDCFNPLESAMPR